MRSTYDLYVKGWSNITLEERQQMLQHSTAPTGIYADPISYSHGPDGLAAVMENFQRKTPGGYFEVDTFVTQHDRALIHWRALDAAGVVRFPGIDAVIFNEEGLLAHISGFFEKPAGMS